MDAQERIRTAVMYGLAYATANRPPGMADAAFQEAAIDAVAREIDRIIAQFHDDGTIVVEPDDQSEED